MAIILVGEELGRTAHTQRSNAELLISNAQHGIGRSQDTRAASRRTRIASRHQRERCWKTSIKRR